MSSTSSQSPLDLIKRMQTSAFSGDWEAFKSLYTERSRYRVGNVVDVMGAQKIADYLRGILVPDSPFRITGMKPRGSWETADCAIVEYDMQAVRVPNQEVSYPCIDLYFFEANKFKDWRVYPIDAQFIAKDRQVEPEPGAGKLPVPEEVNRFQHALIQGDRRRVESLLATDVILRVGNNPESYGPQAFLETLSSVFTKTLQPTEATFRNVWKFENVLVVELDVTGVQAADGRTVSYPCVETYRFQVDKIREYRIYPIAWSLLAATGTFDGRPA